MKLKILLIVAFLNASAIVMCSTHNNYPPAWGFFGHRLINKMAVFTLPPPLIDFYKIHIGYLIEHSVDPDKRRYATKWEAPRHFIDLDMYGEFPFENLSRTWPEFIATRADVWLLHQGKDSVRLFGNGVWREGGREYKLLDDDLLELLGVDNFTLSKKDMHRFVYNVLDQAYRNDEWILPLDSMSLVFGNELKILRTDTIKGNAAFTEHGIVPYVLQDMQRRLTKAFLEKDGNSILRVSAEFGHYIGDAHVPLHTSSNYNGQKTKQDGIHGFWESRIPELLAEETFDFLAGKATYIEKPEAYFWKVIFDSHEGVDFLLTSENELKKKFPQDRQFCYENRLNQVVRTQCDEFTKAYNEMLDGQVEERMREAIFTIGSAWYTAWVDAGQPDLKGMSVKEMTPEQKLVQKELNEALSKGGGYGRSHE